VADEAVVQEEAQEGTHEGARRQVEQAQALLGRLLFLLGVTAEIEQKMLPSGEAALRVRVTSGGEDVGLVGEHSLLQEPVSYLLNKMLNHPPSRAVPMALDFAGEDAPTDEEMTRVGRFLGERAIKLGKILVVGPMSSRDRRAIHLALKEMQGVSSRSEGEGSLRRLLVVPEQLKGPPSEG
jgi:spoIIIJ-associated protein